MAVLVAEKGLPHNYLPAALSALLQGTVRAAATASVTASLPGWDSQEGGSNDRGLPGGGLPKVRAHRILCSRVLLRSLIATSACACLPVPVLASFLVCLLACVLACVLACSF